LTYRGTVLAIAPTQSAMWRRPPDEAAPGRHAEYDQATCLVGQVLDFVSVSNPYPNRCRSRLVHVNVEACLDPTPEPCWRVTLYHLDRELPSR
jgi:hypothetical protein